MTSYEDVLRSLTRAAWGYVFACTNFYLNTGAVSFNFLPTFIGYILFYLVVKLLEDSVKELSLLKIPLIILIIWFAANDVLSIVGTNVGAYLPILELVANILNMYFHFQFLTNLAYLAKRCQIDGCTFDKSLRFFRTVQTIFLTVVAIFNILYRFVDLLSEYYLYFNIPIAFVSIINNICIIVTLIKLKRNLIKPEDILPFCEPFSGTVPTNEGDVPPIAPLTGFDEVAPTPENQKPLTDIE